MTTAMADRPDELLPVLLRLDPAAPRITCYDDALGERIELSGKVLGNWVAKAASLLTEEYAAGPGVSVWLDLPVHWRSAYWALATWTVGATVLIDTATRPRDAFDGSTDGPVTLVLVTTDPLSAAAAAAAGQGAVLVTLPALARGAEHPAEGVIDEARDLAGYPDVFVATDRAEGTDHALVTVDDGGFGAEPYDRLVREFAGRAGDWPAQPRVETDPESLEAFLGQCIATWALGGSVLTTRHASDEPAVRQARREQEQVTVCLWE